MYVCLCRGVTSRTVAEAVAAGARTANAVAEACGAGAECARCRRSVRAIIDAADTEAR
ncbi:(2Fe-2S)-binding protein [[Mycobacterium] wendilense]|uniref:Bacterioferritin-associated ferredoxin n=1 Tax=[Mycobacterium] wendilense TaxID=3064284 RepID=A0ABN9NWM1_9MYCO|nr:(2Fe-2S)-binding protein [Mycolicibacterium sp. MU0050]CAJ1581350.1 (2Fe-2S)-binding protein [Mycolicibacterium sp. MU0050]